MVSESSPVAKVPVPVSDWLWSVFIVVVYNATFRLPGLLVTGAAEKGRLVVTGIIRFHGMAWPGSQSTPAKPCSRVRFKGEAS